MVRGDDDASIFDYLYAKYEDIIIPKHKHDDTNTRI